MSDPKKSLTKTNEASVSLVTSKPLASLQGDPLTQGGAPAVSLSTVPHNERVLASASYFSSFSGFWFVVPGVVYLWKGKQSRFLGFHAIQAILLQVALIPVTFFGLGVGYALSAAIVLLAGDSKGAAIAAMIALFTLTGLAVTVPTAATVWLGLCALRGQPRALPLLGRWANAVIRDV
jgi:uncharacterized membrane protein